METPITFAELNTLPEVRISEFTQAEWAMDQAQRLYGEAAEIERAAWETWSEAVDAERAYEVVTDLLEHAQLAESLRQEAGKRLDEVKAVILAVQS